MTCLKTLCEEQQITTDELVSLLEELQRVTVRPITCRRFRRVMDSLITESVEQEK